MPSPGDRLIGVHRRHQVRRSCLLAPFAWVVAIAQLPAGPIALLACLLERDIGVAAEGKQLFLSSEPVLQAPELSAPRLNEKIETMPVKQLLRPFIWLGVSGRDVGERHWG